MPVRILLADKSITIQKVVEMLFSGKEYEVVSVSDGETALSEAGRAVPDVVLADVDLPRLDGYTFSERLKKDPKLATAPVILMMSRDDVYDAGRGKQAEIIDTIVKPFESQELIGKVKKALLAAPSRSAAATPQPAPAPPRTAAVPPAPATVKAPPAAARPKTAAPADIFDIISEAPTQADVKRVSAPAMEESVYEVEPVVEVEEVDEPLGRDVATALPIGARAVEEMRAGLGLTAKREEPKPEPELFEAFDLAMETEPQPAPSPKRPVVSAPPPSPPAAPVQTPTLPESELRKMAEQTIANMAKDVFAKLPPVQAPSVSDEMLRGMVEEKVSNMTREAFEKLPAVQPHALSASDVWSVAEEAVQKIATEFFEGRQSAPALQSATLPESELRGMAEGTIARMSEEVLKKMPPPQFPKISEETVRRGIEDAVSKIAREVAREVIEKVAWEVIPQLAEVMIKEEIERLKAET
jgi:CheY-like chemotaxis protein